MASITLMSHSQLNITFTHNLIPPALFAGCQTKETVAALVAPAGIILPGHDMAVFMAVRGNTFRAEGLPRPLDFESVKAPVMTDSGITVASLAIGITMMLLLRRHRC